MKDQGKISIIPKKFQEVKNTNDRTLDHILPCEILKSG